MADKPTVVSQNFIQEVREELKKVTWPSRKEVVRLTLVVIIISLVMAFYIGLLDVVFAKVLELLTKAR